MRYYKNDEGPYCNCYFMLHCINIPPTNIATLSILLHSPLHTGKNDDEDTKPWWPSQGRGSGEWDSFHTVLTEFYSVLWYSAKDMHIDMHIKWS